MAKGELLAPGIKFGSLSQEGDLELLSGKPFTGSADDRLWAKIESPSDDVGVGSPGRLRGGVESLNLYCHSGGPVCIPVNLTR